MPAQEDIKSKVMNQKRFLEQLGAFIPGFAGYKEKELRRESDKLLRETLARRLKDLNAELEDVYASITESKLTDAYSILNAATALMDKAISKVETADYGYAGFFDEIKIKEDALDAIYEYDKGLFDDVDYLLEKIGALASAAESEDKEDVLKLAKEVKKLLMNFDKKLDKRKSVLLKLE